MSEIMTLRKWLAFSGFQAAAALAFCLLPITAQAEEPACIAATGQENSATGAGTSGSTCPEEIAPLQVFRDCDVCPEMIALPMGEFMMGAPDDEFRGLNSIFITPRTAEGSYILPNEGPQNKVVVDIPFAMAKNEVTVAEWMACADDGWCGGRDVYLQNFVFGLSSLDVRPSAYVDDPLAKAELLVLEQKNTLAVTREEGLRLFGRYPINIVTYRDSLKFVGWLNWKTGSAGYRLPTEAEWEYAARAGTTTRFAQGFEPTPQQAIISGKQTEFALKKERPDLLTLNWPVPVDALDAANPWGLRHMTGNVAEFTLSCYPEVNGWLVPLPRWDTTSKWLEESSQESCRRAVRGGSFQSGMDFARIAARSGTSEDEIFSNHGFRVVKELN
jgi:formylglycine-generating enzyme required for sulfatase activity